MNKAELIKFVELYNLGGKVESVKIVSDGDKLSTHFRNDTKTLVGYVTYNTLKIDAGEYGINDTAQLRRMLSVLDDTIEVAVVKYDAEAISLSISDKNTESFCMLANLATIPSEMDIEDSDNYTVEIPINDDFVARFVKATAALTDVNETQSFTLMMDKKGKKLELVVGYSTLNSNRIRLEVEPTVGKDVVENPISFDAPLFREILSKNRGTAGAILKIDVDGLAAIEFTTKDYTAKYFMMSKNSED